MSKTIPMIVEVEDIAVGKFLRLLEKTPGIAKYAFDMRGEKSPAKANGSREPSKKFDQKAEDYILDLLAGGLPIATKVMREHFADVGRKPGSTSSALNLLKQDDLIKHNDRKEWVLTKKGRDRMRHRKPAKKARR